MLHRSEHPAQAHGARVEMPAEIHGRPGVVIAWFSPPEPEVGILRPAFVAAVAVDADGVYQDASAEDLELVLEPLRARAEALLAEVAP